MTAAWAAIRVTTKGDIEPRPARDAASPVPRRPQPMEAMATAHTAISAITTAVTIQSTLPMLPVSLAVF